MINKFLEKNKEIQLISLKTVHLTSIWRLANFTHKNTRLPIKNEKLINQIAHTLTKLKKMKNLLLN